MFRKVKSKGFFTISVLILTVLISETFLWKKLGVKSVFCLNFVYSKQECEFYHFFCKGKIHPFNMVYYSKKVFLCNLVKCLKD